MLPFLSTSMADRHPWEFPMAARVIHFGPDDCHRLMVLRTAGYAVDDCRSLLQLSTCLATGHAADAMVTSDSDGLEPTQAIELVKTRTFIPVVLFRSTNLAYEESGIDLVVNCLTPPEIWLREVDKLIERSRAIRAQSQQLIDQSVQLRRESAAARDRARAERQRSLRERARNPEFSANDPFWPKPRAE